MSLFKSVLGAVTGQGGGDSGQLMGALQGMLTNGGGLQGLGELFKKQGLGDVFAGWVSNGPNPPISGQQLQGVLGQDTVNQLASKLGMDGSQASNLLAQFLPDVVDKLTPGGKIDANQNVEQGLAGLMPGLLQSGLGKMLGGFMK